jgi:ribosome recycling factor
MSEIEKKVYADARKLVDESLTEKERDKLAKGFKQKAKAIKDKLEVLKQLAFLKQNLFIKQVAQAQAYMDLHGFNTEKNKLEHLEQGLQALFNKVLQDKQKIVTDRFKDTVIDNLKIEIYHKDLEKRLGFEFQLGQNDYMTAYLSCIIRSD